MGYTLFLCVVFQTKRLGCFCSLSLVACCGKQGLINEFFRGKTEEKVEIKFCTAAIAKFKHYVFRFILAVTFVAFGTRLVRKPHP